jgi:2-C-methyl-D-erythritol 4-phosphate cytidylyltransferase
MSSYRSDSVPLKARGPGSGEVGAIVLAAGSGGRFGGHKQFAELSPGVRLVDRAIEAVLEAAHPVVVVVPPGHDWIGSADVLVVEGGHDRLASVRAGLRALGSPPIVVIHDAAHPLATRVAVAAVIEAIRAGADAALPLWFTPDVVKRESAAGLETVGREGLGLAQVPMAFRLEALERGHDLLASGAVEAVEDSALVELAGGVVRGVPGEVTNVHVVDEMSLDVVRRLARHVSG